MSYLHGYSAWNYDTASWGLSIDDPDNYRWLNLDLNKNDWLEGPGGLGDGWLEPNDLVLVRIVGRNSSFVPSLSGWTTHLSGTVGAVQYAVMSTVFPGFGTLEYLIDSGVDMGWSNGETTSDGFCHAGMTIYRPTSGTPTFAGINYGENPSTVTHSLVAPDSGWPYSYQYTLINQEDSDLADFTWDPSNLDYPRSYYWYMNQYDLWWLLDIETEPPATYGTLTVPSAVDSVSLSIGFS